MSNRRPSKAQPKSAEQHATDPLSGNRRKELSGLPRRIYLTYRNHGLRTSLFRALTFPLRFTPLGTRLALRSRWLADERRRATLWYRKQGRPVSIVIPSYRDAELVESLVAKIHKTVPGISHA